MLVHDIFSYSDNVFYFFKYINYWITLSFKQQLLNSSKLKDFTEDNFKFDENGRKVSERVENTVGKGDIACYEQYLLFKKLALETHKNQGLFEKGLSYTQFVNLSSANTYNLINFKILFFGKKITNLTNTYNLF